MTVREIRVDELSLGADSAVLVDVRSPGDFAQGHLPGAVNVPLDELPAAARYAGRDVVMVCHSCARSAIAAQALAAAGARVLSPGRRHRGMAAGRIPD